MTHSEVGQKENINVAFRAIMAELADNSIALTFFDPNGEDFGAIYQTTWKELLDQKWAEEHELEGETVYRLTGRGWVEGLWRIDAHKDGLLYARMGQLAASLKSRVKDRQADVVVLFHKLAEGAGLPPGWIFNAIESGLLRTVWNMRDASWEDRPGVLVKIPLNFGIKLIDHAADIRAELEEVREELDSAKNRLREVTCPFCEAPIVGQGSIPLSEDVDGYYVEYACGRYDTDGYGVQACPLDPRFPRLEEYELVLIENPKEPSVKWTCFPKAKTENARLLRLSSELGHTADEARQRVIDQYHRRAKP